MNLSLFKNKLLTLIIMGGTACKTEEERIERRREASLRYYHKNKDKLLKDEKYRERRRIGSLKYYNKNKEKCMENVNKWRLQNVVKVKNYNKKAYHKRTHDKEVFFIPISKISS